MTLQTPSAAEARALLFAGIERAKAAKRDPLVVFDLDGTLYDNTHRTLRILLEFAHANSLRYPGLLAALNQLPAAKLTYLIGDTLKALGFNQPELFQEVLVYWKSCFFTNSYCLYDLPTAGSVEFVRQVVQAGGVPVYLTGRDAPNMLIGTLQTLQRDGFPVGRADTRIILKPAFEMEDMVFKRDVIAHLRASGEVVGSFDNEPGLCNLFKENFPEASVVWLDTSHAPGAPELRTDVPAVKDFVPLQPSDVG